MKGFSMSNSDMDLVVKLAEDLAYLEECQADHRHGMVIGDIRVLTVRLASIHTDTYERVGYALPVATAYEIVMGRYPGLTFDCRATPDQIESFSKLPKCDQLAPLQRLTEKLEMVEM